mgnify:CR=1 FL=1
MEVVSKGSGSTLGKVSKYLEVLEDINIFFPTYINKAPCCPPTSIIMPPSTRYAFEEAWTASSDSTLVTVSEKRNIIDSGKKLGHTTVTVTRSGYRPLFTHVEIRTIHGVFIGNQDGFISIEPYSTLTVPLYLQDNHGRLFISPLQHIDVAVYSSNTEVLEVFLSPQKHQL